MDISVGTSEAFWGAAATLLTGIGTWFGSRAYLLHKSAAAAPADTVPQKINGNGHITMEQLREALSNHAMICGGKIEAKIDNLDEKVDEYIGEIRTTQHDLWARVNLVGSEGAENSKQIGIQAVRLADHMAAHQRT